MAASLVPPARMGKISHAGSSSGLWARFRYARTATSGLSSTRILRKMLAERMAVDDAI